MAIFITFCTNFGSYLALNIVLTPALFQNTRLEQGLVRVVD